MLFVQRVLDSEYFFTDVISRKRSKYVSDDNDEEEFLFSELVLIAALKRGKKHFILVLF